LISAISLITELEDALNSSSSEKRLATLRRVTDLFLNEADRLNEQQIALFDDVLVHLVRRIELRARVELSTILAPLPNAPIEVMRRLANDDEITVAHPVLTQSSRLSESDLVEIAKSKSQDHLLAISGRSSLSEVLTDVLVERGDHNVVLACRNSARVFRSRFATIIGSAADDGLIAEKLASRVDLPLPMLRQLLSRATDMVSSRLLTFASLEQRDQIQQALMGISNEVAREAGKPRDFSAAEKLVQQLHSNEKLNEKTLEDFATQHKYEEMTSALALLCCAPVEFIDRLMRNIHSLGLVIACKSAKLSWPTVRDIIKSRFSHHSISEQELDEAKTTFLVLSQASAQRTFRFMLVQEMAKKAA
jgi:uncharacterized protein (DUF2336 family)